MKELSLEKMSEVEGGGVDWYSAVCGALSGIWFLVDDTYTIEAMMVSYGCIPA
ncbi:MAG: hypothetical protein RIM99_06775 [Cyclobacteriaceae bacterium]